MINKNQILVVPVNYISNIDNGFTGASLSLAKSFTRFDSTGVYEPIFKISDNICFIKLSVVMLFKDGDKYLVKELNDSTARPCIELGINSYIYPYSGNHKALLNQMNIILEKKFKGDLNDVSYRFIGYIRDLTNKSTSSTLGSIYYVSSNSLDFTTQTSSYHYTWYTIDELVDRYSKATSWSKKLIDLLLIKTIKL